MTLRLVAHSPDPAHPDPVIAELRHRVAAQRLLIANLRVDLREARLSWWTGCLSALLGGFLFLWLLWAVGL